MVPDTFKSTCGFQAIIVVQCVFEGALTLPGNLNIILPPPACFDDHLALRSGTVGIVVQPYWPQVPDHCPNANRLQKKRIYIYTKILLRGVGLYKWNSKNNLCTWHLLMHTRMCARGQHLTSHHSHHSSLMRQVRDIMPDTVRNRVCKRIDAQ